MNVNFQRSRTGYCFRCFPPPVLWEPAAVDFALLLESLDASGFRWRPPDSVVVPAPLLLVAVEILLLPVGSGAR